MDYNKLHINAWKSFSDPQNAQIFNNSPFCCQGPKLAPYQQVVIQKKIKK